MILLLSVAIGVRATLGSDLGSVDELRNPCVGDRASKSTRKCQFDPAYRQEMRQECQEMEEKEKAELAEEMKQEEMKKGIFRILSLDTDSEPSSPESEPVRIGYQHQIWPDWKCPEESVEDTPEVSEEPEECPASNAGRFPVTKDCLDLDAEIRAGPNRPSLITFKGHRTWKNRSREIHQDDWAVVTPLSQGWQEVTHEEKVPEFGISEVDPPSSPSASSGSSGKERALPSANPPSADKLLNQDGESGDFESSTGKFDASVQSPHVKNPKSFVDLMHQKRKQPSKQQHGAFKKTFDELQNPLSDASNPQGKENEESMLVIKKNVRKRWVNGSWKLRFLVRKDNEISFYKAVKQRDGKYKRGKLTESFKLDNKSRIVDETSKLRLTELLPTSGRCKWGRYQRKVKPHYSGLTKKQKKEKNFLQQKDLNTLKALCSFRDPRKEKRSS